MELGRFSFFRRAARVDIDDDVVLMPAYESPDSKLLVMESMRAVFGNAATRNPLLVPFGYDQVVDDFETGPVRLVEGGLPWRPCLYTLMVETTLRLGSQQELSLRLGFHEAIQESRERRQRWRRFDATLRDEGKTDEERRQACIEWFDAERAAPPGLPSQQATSRARELLLRFLSPQQRLEYLRFNTFHVRGTINRLYQLHIGDGTAIVDPLTQEPLVALCLHSEEWIPDEDNALAVKLLIESGADGEEQFLAACEPLVYSQRQRPRRFDRAAWQLHHRLLPGPQQVLAPKGRFQ